LSHGHEALDSLQGLQSGINRPANLLNRAGNSKMTQSIPHQNTESMFRKKVELLAPAGDFGKLEVAIHYGADAVYLGGKTFSLRNFSGNFSINELDRAIQSAHDSGVKVYVACNIFSRNAEQNAIADYLEKLSILGPDALIIADPGVLMMARIIAPDLPIHLSTQANTTNFNSVLFWEQLGIKRVNIARELSLKEIKDITSKSSVEIEAFVHGSMCIAYSGRCLLSNYMTCRDSNHGDCSHSCRWKYAVVEETRPGQYLPIEEDDRGAYIFSSKDLCMIEHLDELIDSGVSSLKIEGRMKGINYLASAVKIYREALDAYYENPDTFNIKREWIEELDYGNYRGYCTGFYLNDPKQLTANTMGPKSVMDHRLVGQVKRIAGNRLFQTMVFSKLTTGATVEIFKAEGPPKTAVIEDIQDEKGKRVSFVQPGSLAILALSCNCTVHDLIRKKVVS